MYAKADTGEIPDFPGVTAPYEVPRQPDLVLPSHELTVEQCVDRIVAHLERVGVLGSGRGVGLTGPLRLYRGQSGTFACEASCPSTSCGDS